MAMRSCGILMPIASLPSAYGIGCFDQAAYDFVDQLQKAGQRYWQILPMGPTGYGDSPYQSFSTFAGNPYFISLETLIEKGYLTKEECEKESAGTSEDWVEYSELYSSRFTLLKTAFERSNCREQAEYHEFVDKNAVWLKNYAVFMAIKDEKKGESYLEWEDDIRFRKPEAMERYQNQLQHQIDFYQFLQFEFSSQWSKLKKYANDRGVQIIGDIPIYVALDSADTWASPELFQFDEKGEPKAVAGCPPDGFSATGQLWGNPLYDWDAHLKQNYDWWIRRIGVCLSWYDMVRIDHFRGFDEYYSIPYGDKTAENGHWEKGPGAEMFHRLKNWFGELPIIAEDLGFLTDGVRNLLKESGFPGMKVLQFAFDASEDSDYLPYRYDTNCVVYTGTHDNTTTYGWWETMADSEKAVALAYLNRRKDTPTEELTWDLICLALGSKGDLCMIPMQDYLTLGKEARINTPSTLGYNWKWRMKPDVFDDDLCLRIRKAARLYGRI